MRFKSKLLLILVLAALVFRFVFSGILASAAGSVRHLTGDRFRSGRIQQTSLNWAGYAAASGKFTAVTGSWIIPKVRSSSNLKTDAAWVGIGGVSSQDLIQAGTTEVTVFPGKTGYLAWYEMLPDFSQPVALAVQAGDSITAAINQKSGNRWQIILKNNSSGKIFQKNVVYTSTFSSAEWIEEMPSNSDSQLIPLDNFGVIQFSGGSAVRNKVKVNIAKSGARAISLANSQGKILAAPSVLQNSGSAFYVKRLPGQIF